MNFHVTQNIQINLIKINAIANSSVFQIGSAGIIKPVTKLANTGQYNGPTLKPVKKEIIPFKISP